MTASATILHAPGETIAAADLVVVRLIDALGFVAAMARGDRYATRVMFAVNDSLHRLDTAPRSSPILCAACPAPLRPGTPYSFVLHLPADERVPYGFALAVCRRCGTSRGEIRRKAVAALRTELPDLRVVEATHASGGRA